MRKEIIQRNNSLKTLRRKVQRAGLDALVVSDENDVIYLTGFFSKGVKLLVTARGRPLYLIDKTNETLAHDRLKGVEFEDIIAAPILKTLKRIIKEKRLKKVGFNENNLSAYEYKALTGGNQSLKLRYASFMLEEMRKKKQKREIAILRRAGRETVKIWKQLKKSVKTGMSEKEIATMLNILIRSKGYDNAFSPIVAISENAAYPHAVPTERRMKKGDHLLVDFGIRLEGYCSDLTRTYYNGRINRQIMDFRKLVHEAHDQAIKKIKPGAIVGVINKGISKYFNDNNVDDYVLHGLGHGVGLDIHERPFFRSECRERLKEGMVITVEPGLYKAGLGGVREEDMVLVTAKGCEVLTV